MAKKTEVIDEEIELSADDELEIAKIKNFFNDPKSSGESKKFRHMVRYVLAEVMEEKTQDNPGKKEEGFLDFIFKK